MGIAYNPKIVTDGLVLCLDAANPKSYPGTGTTWTDLSSNGNNGTLINGVGYSSDNKGALTFDGVNDNIQLPPLTAGKSEITLNMWVYPIIISGQYHIYTEGWGSGYWQFSITAQGWYTRDISIGATGVRNNDISTNFLIANKWNYITAVYSVSNAFKGYYVDGILKSSSTTSIDTLTVQRDFNSAFIARPTDGLYFNGNVSLVQMYNHALTTAQIQQNFNAARGRYGI
jgi:hypothetical protein